MAKKVFPDKMAPILPFLRGVEVMGAPQPKNDDDGEQKKAGDLLQWVISVIVPEGRLLTERRVTVVAAERPEVRDGQTIIFPDLRVGSYINKAGRAALYFRATDVRVAAKGAKGESDD